MALKYWVLIKRDSNGDIEKVRTSWFTEEKAEEIRNGEDPDWAVWSEVDGPYTHDQAYTEALRLKPESQEGLNAGTTGEDGKK